MSFVWLAGFCFVYLVFCFGFWFFEIGSVYVALAVLEFDV